MSRSRRALQQAVKAAAASVDLVRQPARGVVILIYHRVGARSGLEVDLPVELFDEQMAVLAESGSVVTLDRALDCLFRDTVDQRAQIVVTFDDGTADFADVAVPILARHGVPATLYLATAFAEEGREFPNGGTPVSWSGLADACATGLVNVGSHTHRHVLLDRLDPREVEDDLDRSIGLIRERLGRPAHHFAYPKAVPPSVHAERAVRARFRSAALGGTRANPNGATDPYRLARSPVQRTDGMTWFRRKLTGGMRLEDDLRRMLNRYRYAETTT